MRISLACNWKPDVLAYLDENPDIKRTVHDFYGARDMSFTGSGRPYFLMQKLDRDRMGAFIDKVHRAGHAFTWLWNGQCLGYYKFNAAERSKAIEELDWLEDLGVEYLTVTDPYLARFVRRRYPKIHLKVSVIAEVSSLARARDWQEIVGKDGVITISIFAVRNFPLLEEIRKQVPCDFEILVNDCCLNECPFRFFHYTECSHASQTHDKLQGFYQDWCTIACQLEKDRHPEQAVMSKWVQPSDVDKYLAIGYDYFKLSGRRYNVAWHKRMLHAYATKSYAGDYGMIFNGYSFVSDPLLLAGSQFQDFAKKQELAGGSPEDQGVMLAVPDFGTRLEGGPLATLLDRMPFRGARCAQICGVSCRYCHAFAREACVVSSPEKASAYRQYMEFLLNYIDHSEMFAPAGERRFVPPVGERQANTYVGVSWTPEAREFLDAAMVIIPEDMREAARMGTGVTTERTAERLGLKEVGVDLLASTFIHLTPPQFRHDAHDFLVKRGIDPGKYLSASDIEEIVSSPAAGVACPPKVTAKLPWDEEAIRVFVEMLKVVELEAPMFLDVARVVVSNEIQAAAKGSVHVPEVVQAFKKTVPQQFAESLQRKLVEMKLE
jgi:collagenase-like PrtC family protease